MDDYIAYYSNDKYRDLIETKFKANDDNHAGIVAASLETTVDRLVAVVPFLA